MSTNLVLWAREVFRYAPEPFCQIKEAKLVASLHIPCHWNHHTLFYWHLLYNQEGYIENMICYFICRLIGLPKYMLVVEVPKVSCQLMDPSYPWLCFWPPLLLGHKGHLISGVSLGTARSNSASMPSPFSNTCNNEGYRIVPRLALCCWDNLSFIVPHCYCRTSKTTLTCSIKLT